MKTAALDSSFGPDLLAHLGLPVPGAGAGGIVRVSAAPAPAPAPTQVAMPVVCATAAAAAQPVCWRSEAFAEDLAEPSTAVHEAAARRPLLLRALAAVLRR